MHNMAGSVEEDQLPISIYKGIIRWEEKHNSDLLWDYTLIKTLLWILYSISANSVLLDFSKFYIPLNRHLTITPSKMAKIS